jgi:hypothetical protein
MTLIHILKGDFVMQLELKAIKHSKFMSHETSCFEARLYFNGRFFADVCNEGQGGPDMVTPPFSVRNASGFTFWEVQMKMIDDYFAGLPVLPDPYFPDGIEQTLELWCGKQLDLHLAKKELKSILRRKVLYTNADKIMYTTGFENNARLKVREPSAKILNDLPFDEALAIYMGENVCN